MEDLVENDPNPILLLNRQGTVSFANRAARALTEGRQPAELADLIPSEVGERLLARGAALLDSGAKPDATWNLTTTSVGGRAFTVSIAGRKSSPEAELVLRMRPRRDVDDRGDTVLRRLVAHTPGSGHTFFEQLVVQLSAKLGVKYALVAAVDPKLENARTLALCTDGVVQEPVSYKLRGTPCEGAAIGGVCFVPEDAAAAFPDDPLLVAMGVHGYVGVRLTDDDGQVLGILAIMHDGPIDEALDPIGFVRLFAARTATELRRMQAESEADRQRQFSERLLDQVDALVLVLDDSGTIVRANRTVQRVTGWREADLLGTNLTTSFSSERATSAVRAALQAAIPVVMEDTWTTADGRQRQIRWQVRPVVRGTGLPGHLLVTGVDLTDLEHARQERDELQGRLRQAQRLESLGRLAGGVAHDFNNLLLAILGYADLIQSQPSNRDEVLASALEIRRAADHAASLTRQLLAFGRRQHLERRALDLVDVMQSATSVLRPLLPDNVELQVELPREPLPVRADPSRLEQIIVNLGTNARDAMPDGGSLRLRATMLPASESPLSLRGRSVAMVEVSDTGEGIDESVLPHIFEPFFTTKELGQGTGLGLASVYGTVQQHGGTVDVQTSTDHGTTFRIFLPVDESTPVMAVPAPDNVAGPGAGRRILIAEDDERVRCLVGRLLQGAGYVVVAHPDGLEAWEAFRARPTDFDLVLADVLMPRMGGVDLAARIRAHSPDKPVMLTSGFVADISEFPHNVTLLPKPYMPDELLSAVGEALAAG